MAIDNPQVVAFSNQEVRTAADKLAATYWQAKAFLVEWTTSDFDTLLPNDNTEAGIIDDGSATDGRTPIKGRDIHNLKGYLEGFVADLEANSNQKLNILAKIEVNGNPS